MENGIIDIYHGNTDIYQTYMLDENQQALTLINSLIIPQKKIVEYTNCFSAEGWEPPNECPGYNTKQSDSEVLVMLELWGMWSIP